LFFLLKVNFGQQLKNTKGFQNMGTVVKLLTAACFDLALRAITTRIPHHPLVVAALQIYRFYFSMCLQQVTFIRSLPFGGDSSYLTVIHPHYSRFIP